MERNYAEYFSLYANIIRERYRRVKYRIVRSFVLQKKMDYQS